MLYPFYNVLPAGAYTEAVAKAAEDNQDFVMGFISIAPSAWKSGPGSPGETCYKSRLSWLGQMKPSQTSLSALALHHQHAHLGSLAERQPLVDGSSCWHQKRVSL